METVFRRREQEVWQACDDLWSVYGDMSHLTGEAIKSHLVSLGKSRGSPNEIYKYRRSWEEHRGVKRGSEKLPFEDPIARAARLVHEEIKASAQNEINELSENFEKELKTLNDRIRELEENLARTVQEYAKLTARFEESALALEKTKLLFQSEEEMRKALERELAQVRMIAQEKEAGLINNIESIKELHEREMTRQKSEYQERIIGFEKIEQELKEDIKKLGYQYSEDLSAMKVTELNQRILLEKSESRAVFLEKQVEEQKKVHEEKEALLKAQISSLSEAYQALKSERSESLSVNKADQEKLRSLFIAAKKSDLTIARLRETLRYYAHRK